MGLRDELEHAVQASEKALSSTRAWASFWRFVTLGIYSGAQSVRLAEQHLVSSRIRLEKYLQQRTQADSLDDELLRTVTIHGVRVSFNVFSDLPAVGHSTYPADWENLRQNILDRDSYQCQEADGMCDGPLQIHHKQPLSKGGSNQLGNLITLCLYHHCTKHPHMMDKYYGHLRGRRTRH